MAAGVTWLDLPWIRGDLQIGRAVDYSPFVDPARVVWQPTSDTWLAYLGQPGQQVGGERYDLQASRKLLDDWLSVVNVPALMHMSRTYGLPFGLGPDQSDVRRHGVIGYVKFPGDVVGWGVAVRPALEALQHLRDVHEILTTCAGLTDLQLEEAISWSHAGPKLEVSVDFPGVRLQISREITDRAAQADWHRSRLERAPRNVRALRAWQATLVNEGLLQYVTVGFGHDNGEPAFGLQPCNLIGVLWGLTADAFARGLPRRQCSECPKFFMPARDDPRSTTCGQPKCRTRKSRRLKTAARSQLAATPTSTDDAVRPNEG